VKAGLPGYVHDRRRRNAVRTFTRRSPGARISGPRLARSSILWKNWRRRTDLNRGWRYCRFRLVVNDVGLSCLLVDARPRRSMLFGRFWSRIGLESRLALLYQSGSLQRTTHVRVPGRRCKTEIAEHSNRRRCRRELCWSAGIRESVGETQFDEGLPGHTNSFRFPVDRPEQVHWKIDVHPLDFAPWTSCVGQVQMRAELFPRIVHLIKARGTEHASLRGTALLRQRACGGPR
jgi:hypothetical protein